MVPVHTDVVAVYEMYLIERAAVPTAAECDFVFVNVFHEPLGAPMRYATAHQLLAGLSRKAGLARRVTPHMLRHGTSRAERLSDVLGQEVVAQVAASGVTAADPTIHEQIASLQARSGELEGELRRRDEELDAVRQANRDLMGELNRRRPQR